MRAALLLASILLATRVSAAPDEIELGKAEGYPVCGADRQKCLVGVYSEIHKFTKRVHKVAKADAPRPFKRDDKAAELGAAAFMDANRNTGLLVLKGDTILAERYNYDRTPAHRFGSQSMAKTVVGMLVGIALAEKKIHSIDDKARQYVPELKGQPYGDTSLRDLLTMSSGMRFRDEDANRSDGDLLNRLTFNGQGKGGVATVLPFSERDRGAGQRFHYASSDSQVLSLVLRAAVGKPLAEYLSEKIWRPMGAEADALWFHDAGGYEFGFCCLYATLRDYARFGMLLAYGGRAGPAPDAPQIIPAEWVKASTTAESAHLQYGVAARDYGYGYQTWLLRRDGQFALRGVRGQWILVDPRNKIVVVHTAVHRKRGDVYALDEQFKYFNEVVRKLASGMKE